MNLKTKRLFNKLKRKETELKILKTEVYALSEQLRTICEHPEEEIENQVTNYSGSYYDRASTTRWRQCKICGTMSEKETITHGWYG